MQVVIPDAMLRKGVMGSHLSHSPGSPPGAMGHRLGSRNTKRRLSLHFCKALLRGQATRVLLPTSWQQNKQARQKALTKFRPHSCTWEPLHTHLWSSRYADSCMCKSATVKVRAGNAPQLPPCLSAHPPDQRHTKTKAPKAAFPQTSAPVQQDVLPADTDKEIL